MEIKLDIKENHGVENSKQVLNYSFFREGTKVLWIKFSVNPKDNQKVKYEIIHFYGDLSEVKKALIGKVAFPILEEKLIERNITKVVGRTNHRMANFLKKTMGSLVHGKIIRPYPPDGPGGKINISKTIKSRARRI